MKRERILQVNIDNNGGNGAFPDRPYDSKAIWGDDEKIKKIMMNRASK